MKINDKVVCIDDIEKNIHFKFKIFYPSFPQKGQTYVIRKVVEPTAKNCPTKTIYLTGINSKNNESGYEMGWNSIDFQLLDEYNKNPRFSGEYDWLNKNEE